MLEEILNKYNIVHIDGCRYYLINLKERSFDFEFTAPYCITINGVTIFDSSWKNIIPRIVEELDSKMPKSKQELLNIKCDWGKQCVFGEDRKSNFTPYKDIYINTNHTAIHAMWIIQLLLDEYHIDLNQCEFVLKRQPLAEPKEVREFFKKETIKKFQNFLRGELKKSEEAVSAIVKNIDFVNTKILSSVSTGYYDFFLIEDPAAFANYSKKANELLEEKNYSQKVKQTIERQLNYLYEYVKKANKENKIKFSNYSCLKKSEKAIDKFLSDFDAIV